MQHLPAGADLPAPALPEQPSIRRVDCRRRPLEDPVAWLYRLDTSLPVQ